MKLSRIGLLALVAVCMAWFVPQASAGAPQDFQAVPSGTGVGTVVIFDDGQTWRLRGGDNDLPATRICPYAC